MRPFTDMTRERYSSGRIRLRSACESSRLSKGASSRTGAGASAPGRGASGRSYRSLPCSSRKVVSCGASPASTAPSLVSPHHFCTSAAVAGPNAAR